jgi:signal transduction histidine kinase/HAMP domain-containing protein/ActR/RegA family two-component response regulator
MTSLSSLRFRLIGTVFIAVVPALVVVYFTSSEVWAAFLVGLVALGAAWFGGERFVLRQVRALFQATERLAAGDLSTRTGLGNVKGELGQLARSFDGFTESLQQRAREQVEEAERTLLNRALQQTAVAALGQFAIVSTDIQALFNQVVMLVTQTLEIEFCQILELLPDRHEMILRAGMGWKDNCVGRATVKADSHWQEGYTLDTGEPVVVGDLRAETRFQPSPLLRDHGVVSGVTVVISTRQGPHGVLGVHSTRARTFTGDEVHFLLAVATVLAVAIERLRADADLQKLAAFTQLNPNPAMELAPNGTVTYFNEAALKLASSVHAERPDAVLPPNVAEILQTCLATDKSHTHLETRIQDRTFSWSFHPVALSRVVHCYVEDITNRLNLENQLRQSQKMESVGQLAAGVAHDFNNMLTIIQGYAGILLARPGLSRELLDPVQAIAFAAERAAGLTRQLLMFSRKNVMQSKQLDLRDVVANMNKMLQRILGETVTLEFTPPPELPAVKGDAGMMEQILMNLAVNARDAMPKGGTLAINLSPLNIDDDYVKSHPEAHVGDFVRLRVADTGTGMDAATMARIFEPFFTTKEVGKGTGLGLATVYGIVKQHSGWIEVTSEVGKGTAFSVFFPASGQTTRVAKENSDPAAFIRGGHETILIVEDESVLRELAHAILSDCGYRIIEAASGREALDVWERHQGEIDLVLTDIIMPEGVTGLELAKKLLSQRPNVKIIFTSGYTVDDVSTDFLARTNNARFIQKPYTRAALAKTVRQALDGKSVEALPDAAPVQ